MLLMLMLSSPLPLFSPYLMIFYASPCRRYIRFFFS